MPLSTKQEGLPGCTGDVWVQTVAWNWTEWLGVSRVLQLGKRALPFPQQWQILPQLEEQPSHHFRKWNVLGGRGFLLLVVLKQRLVECPLLCREDVRFAGSGAW